MPPKNIVRGKYVILVSSIAKTHSVETFVNKCGTVSSSLVNRVCSDDICVPIIDHLYDVNDIKPYN